MQHESSKISQYAGPAQLNTTVAGHYNKIIREVITISNKNHAAKAAQQNTDAYDVKIHAVHLDGPVLADVSATYNRCFAMRGLKLVSGEDGPYVTMPGYQSARGFVEVCTTNSPEVYEQLKGAVLDAYRQKLTQMREQSLGAPKQEQAQNAPAQEQIPTTVGVKINTLREGPTLADASIDIGGAFTVNGVRIVNSENGLFVGMPGYRTASGYNDICFPCTTEFHEQVKNSVLNGYQQAIAQIYDQTAAAAPEQEQSAAPSMGMAQSM